jgi:outer membrane biosynthesis protein TonB
MGLVLKGDREMFEIKIMLDASDRLADALHHIADALSGVRAEKPVDNSVEIQAPEIDAQMPSECVETPEQPETPANEEEPKKRKPRSKKPASEPEQPKAEPEQPKDETVPEPEPEPEQPKAEPAPEQPKAEPEQTQDDDPLAGKGQSGEVLNELTKKAVQVLDALGIDRAVANRRIREYCAGNDIKFPTFPALLQAVGYAAAIAVCRGEI